MVEMGGKYLEDIMVGVGEKMNGRKDELGEKIKRGVEEDVEEENEKGGMNGEKIKIVYGDEDEDKKKGIQVEKKLVGDGVKFVIGNLN